MRLSLALACVASRLRAAAASVACVTATSCKPGLRRVMAGALAAAVAADSVGWSTYRRLQLALARVCQLCLSLLRLHLELAACKTLGISPSPHLALEPLEARLQAGATPCDESKRSRPQSISRGLRLKSRALLEAVRAHVNRRAALRTDRSKPAEPAARSILHTE